MRVLVVEDDPTIADGLRRGLTADGFTVDVTGDGIDGLWLARQHPYAVIVLDLMLPGLNGYKVCERLRAADVWTPVLMLTAKDGELDQTDGFDVGADDYLTKPFHYSVLLARIRALLRRTGSAPAVRELLEAGDLVVDPASRTATRTGQEIELSPKAFDVLEVLIRNAGDVLTKDAILEHAWDHAFDGDPNIVEVYISRLRAAIDAPFGRDTIQTVRGVGYRLRRAST